MRIIKTVYTPIISIIALALIIYSFILWQQFLKAPIIPVSSSYITIIKPGTTIKQIANNLHSQGYLAHPQFLVWLAKFTGQANKIKAGEYQFEGGITPERLLHKLLIGDVLKRYFTIIEGWTFKQALSHLQQAPRLKITLEGISIEEIATKLGIDRANPEGLLFPDTYQYTMGTLDIDILKRAYLAMQQKLQHAWDNRSQNLPYKDAYEALIAASMIEKETGVAEERPVVAEVIVNRLRKRMYMQIDPTIIYGLGDYYNGKLTTADMRSNTPYNTYIHKGLPPTPIALPGEASIHAALNPTEGDELYFVSKGDGSHHFSSNLKEHDKAIRKYQLNK